MKNPMPPHDHPPLDAAVAAFREMPVPPCPADGAWMARVVPGPSPAIESSAHLRRSLLMRIVPLSAAAAALVAVAVGVASFLAGPASIALGDVIRAAEQHKLVKFRVIQGCETKDGSAVQPMTQEAFADLKAPRFRTVQRSPGVHKGALDFESIFVMDGTKGVMLHRITEVVTEKGKTDPEAIEQLKMFEPLGVPRKLVELYDYHGDLSPATADTTKSVLENLRELERHRDAVATKGKFRGVDVLKYRVEDGPHTTTLLVDAATKLPVRMEYESTDPGRAGPGVTKVSYTMSDFEWDPEPDGARSVDELFSTEPSAGYKVEDLRKAKDKAGR